MCHQQTMLKDLYKPQVGGLFEFIKKKNSGRQHLKDTNGFLLNIQPKNM